MNEQLTKTVLLTRSAADNAEWASELRARGFEPIECACIETVQLASGPELSAALQRADWLACTSRRAVDAVHSERSELTSTMQLAAVGPATAERMRTHFGRCDLESTEGTGADLGRALVKVGATAPVVITVQNGRTDIEHALAAGGLTASRFELYATRAITTPLPTQATNAGVAFFASPSSVRAFAARGELNSDCVTISIGPSTSVAMHEAGLPVHAEARTRDLDGMLNALATTSISQR